jgi:enoyl-CoA hydratase/carnithine racemase
VGLVSCCDIALGVSKATFTLSEVKLGILPATISPYVIARIGTAQARRWERFADLQPQSPECNHCWSQSKHTASSEHRVDLCVLILHMHPDTF